jgi:integrase
MITLYRRHLESCKHTSRRHKGCRCPIWAEGKIHGKKIRKSLDLRNWEAASKLTRDWEIHAPEKTVTVSDAIDRFLADAKARGLSAGTLLKYEQSMKALKDTFGKQIVRQLTVDDMRKLRESWKISALTMQKRLEMVKAFFKFCIAADWIEKNPAKAVKGPKVYDKPTLPFSDEELKKVWKALDEEYLVKHPGSSELVKKKIRAFILVMLYSGVRISDAVLLKKEKVNDGMLFLYTHKTKVPVRVPLPNEAIAALSECGAGEFYFTTGNGKVKTWTTEWEERLKKVFVLAGMPDAHSHMLRDTFATRLLVQGVPLETVAALLGNTVKVVEKHYSPWVQARQTNLEESVRKTWAVNQGESTRAA